MTKQKKIQEGIAKLITVQALKAPTEREYKRARAIMHFLHSQDVVIKVDCKKCAGTGRVLFFYPRPESPPGNMYIECENCKGIGLIAIEPLIGKDEK